MAKIKTTKGGLNDNLFKELTDAHLDTDSEKTANIVEFAEATWGLNIKLTPVQRFMLKCLFNVPLYDTERNVVVRDWFNSKTLDEFTEVEFAKWCYDEGRCNIDFSKPENIGRNYYEMILSLGRRSGKSLISAVIIDYMLYVLTKLEDPQAFYNIPTGQEIAVIGTAPTDGQAAIVFDAAQIFALNCQVLRSRIAHPTQTYFEVQSNHDIDMFGKGKRGSIQFITGGSSSNSLRGHNDIAIVIDEMAFFVENGGRFSIEEVYGALTPSIAKFSNKDTGKMDGKILCLSSPYAHFGMFFNLFRDGFTDENRKNGNRICFKFYTALVNPDAAPESYLRNEYRQDRKKFVREFGAEFDERVTSWIDDDQLFRQNVLRPYTNTLKGKRGVRYFWAFDLGTSDDGCACAVVHHEKDKAGLNDKYVLDFAEVWFASEASIWESTQCEFYKIHEECGRWRHKDQIPLHEMAGYIRDKLCKIFPIFEGILDQYSGHAFFQILQHSGIQNVELTSINTRQKCKVYQLFKDLYRENMLDLMDHPVLIPEMMNLEAEKIAHGLVNVNKRKSNDKSFQDDISDAVVRAVWKCWQFHNGGGQSNNKGKVPSIISFGNGITFSSDGAEYGDLAQQLKYVKNQKQYQRIKDKMHGFGNKRSQ